MKRVIGLVLVLMTLIGGFIYGKSEDRVKSLYRYEVEVEHDCVDVRYYRFKMKVYRGFKFVKTVEAVGIKQENIAVAKAAFIRDISAQMEVE